MQFEMHDNVKGKGGITEWTGNPSSPRNLATSLPWAPWLRRQLAPACTPEVPEMREPSSPGPDVEEALSARPPTCGAHPFPRCAGAPPPAQPDVQEAAAMGQTGVSMPR